MAAKKKARKVKAKSTSRKRSTKRSVKDLSPRGTAKSVKGGLLPAVRPALGYPDAASKIAVKLSPGTLAAGDGSV
jgi:hypothetical protein